LNASLLTRAVSVLLALFCSDIATIPAQSAPPLKLKQTFPLAGVEGRTDHFAFAPNGERLFVCALGNNSVEVLVAVPHRASHQAEVRCYQIE
jgi:hypothetical protein